ncbi:MAG: hypothetical protein R3B99_10580 [Polyangiales bacterium]
MTMRRPLTLALFAFALLAVDVSLGATTSTAEGQSSVRESRARRARRARRERRAREAREEAERNAREAETAEATPETATEASPEETPSLAESQSRRLDFDARVIRGETAGRGAIVLFERGGRAFAPLARVRRKFLLPTILAVFGEEPARPAEDER